MERISIFNYEAFYLDHLEGNLSEEDTRMLMQFLEEHPECQLESEEIMELDAEETFVFSGKMNLKQVDETAPVTFENAEHFIIAEAEGVLNAEKTEELQSVVSKNESLAAMKKRYAAVYFAPDKSLVYADKKGLKRRATIILWPYVSGVAAAAVIAFIFMTNLFNVSYEELNVSLNNWNPEMPNVASLVNGKNDGKDPNVSDPADPNGSIKVASKRIEKKNNNVAYVSETRLKSRPAVQLTSFDDVALKPVSTAKTDKIVDPNAPIFQERIEKNDVSMKNPIAPITNFISEKSNTEVDFGQRKSSNKKKGGFYVKIGKFEVSKNKH